MQRFTFVMDDPSYDLHLKQTLTIKSHEFYIHAIPRTDRKSIVPIPTPSSRLLRSNEDSVAPTSVPADDSKKRLYVLYGSNTGTSEAFAQRIAPDAAGHGKQSVIP